MRKLPEIERGTRFGRLLALSSQKRGKVVYISCRCDCGSMKDIRADHLRTQAIRSCGCLLKETTSRLASDRKKHGHARHGHMSPTYVTWISMRGRCSDQRHPQHKYYGARGISVCDRWQSFDAFLADMGARPSRNYTIDRIDNFRGYEPGNCRWATASEQARNKRPKAIKTLMRGGA